MEERETMKIKVSIKPEMFRPPEGATHYRAFVSGFSDKMKVSIVWYKVTWDSVRNTLLDVEMYDEDTNHWDFCVPADGVGKLLKALTEVPKLKSEQSLT